MRTPKKRVESLLGSLQPYKTSGESFQQKAGRSITSTRFLLKTVKPRFLLYTKVKDGIPFVLL